MSKSRAQLISKVLSNLGLGNDTPAAEDVAKVDAIVDDIVVSLSRRTIYTVSDPGVLGPSGGNIEPEIFQELAAIVAAAAAPEFDDTDPKYEVLASRAESRMETVAAPSRTLRTARLDAAVLTPRRGGFYNGQG
jgi:hypothetical protein